MGNVTSDFAIVADVLGGEGGVLSLTYLRTDSQRVKNLLAKFPSFPFLGPLLPHRKEKLKHIL